MLSSSEDEDDPEIIFLKSLSRKQKMKLLKKLDKEEGGNDVTEKTKSKKKKSKKKKKRRSQSDSDDEVWVEKEKTPKGEKRRH